MRVRVSRARYSAVGFWDLLPAPMLRDSLITQILNETGNDST